MRLIRYFIWLIGLVISCLMIFYVMSFLSWVMLVPFDSTVIRPDLGTWQRTLNDFFASDIGSSLVIILSAAITVLPVFRTLYRRPISGLRLIIANILFAFSSFFVVPFIGFQWIYDVLPNFAYTPGYLTMLFPFLILVTFYAIWFREIVSLGERGEEAEKEKNKAKNHSEERVIQRLADDIAENHLVYENEGFVRNSLHQDR